ncbi:hypothetical protein V2W45_1249428, partial [Cenococcum geophilum]
TPTALLYTCESILKPSTLMSKMVYKVYTPLEPRSYPIPAIVPSLSTLSSVSKLIPTQPTAENNLTLPILDRWLLQIA